MLSTVALGILGGEVTGLIALSDQPDSGEQTKKLAMRITAKEDSERQLRTMTGYRYDSLGWVVQEDESMSYAYDSTGNWTTCTMRRSAATEITNRSIAYD